MDTEKTVNESAPASKMIHSITLGNTSSTVVDCTVIWKRKESSLRAGKDFRALRLLRVQRNILESGHVNSSTFGTRSFGSLVAALSKSDLLAIMFEVLCPVGYIRSCRSTYYSIKNKTTV